MAAGASAESAAAIAIPFAVLFSASTLAVRVVILRARRGGDLPAANALRRAVFSLAGGATAALTLATVTGQLSPSVLVATIPGLLMASVVAAYPPGPTHLRTLGWSLIGVSAVTAALVVLGVSGCCFPMLA
jgi:hypothetical protein